MFLLHPGVLLTGSFPRTQLKNHVWGRALGESPLEAASPAPSAVSLSHILWCGEGLLAGERALEVHACGLPYGFSLGEGTSPAQEGMNRPAGKLHPLEGSVFLGGEEAFGRHGVGLGHVYDGEVGVGADGDRTLAGAQAVGERRVGRDEFHAAQQRETVFRAFGKDEGIDQSRPAETGECLPEVTLFVLLRTAGVVGADPIDLTACHTAPERIHICLGPYGRVDLAALVFVVLVGEREVVERRLQPNIEVRIKSLQLQRRLEGLLAGEVEEVYGAARVAGEDAYLCDSEVFGQRRARGAVGFEA